MWIITHVYGSNCYLFLARLKNIANMIITTTVRSHGLSWIYKIARKFWLETLFTRKGADTRVHIDYYNSGPGLSGILQSVHTFSVFFISFFFVLLHCGGIKALSVFLRLSLLFFLHIKIFIILREWLSTGSSQRQSYHSTSIAFFI